MQRKILNTKYDVVSQQEDTRTKQQSCANEWINKPLIENTAAAAQMASDEVVAQLLVLLVWSTLASSYLFLFKHSSIHLISLTCLYKQSEPETKLLWT